MIVLKLCYFFEDALCIVSIAALHYTELLRRTVNQSEASLSFVIAERASEVARGLV